MVVSSSAIARIVPFPRQVAGTNNVRFNEGLPAKDKPCLNARRFVKENLFKGRM
jgi:hypothetical protein